MSTIWTRAQITQKHLPLLIKSPFRISIALLKLGRTVDHTQELSEILQIHYRIKYDTVLLMIFCFDIIIKLNATIKIKNNTVIIIAVSEAFVLIIIFTISSSTNSYPHFKIKTDKQKLQ